MKRTSDRLLIPREEAELAGLAELPEAAIDTSDAPQISDWSQATRGRFFRPVKQQLTLRLDADLIAWFRKHATKGEGYQTRINRALRDYVQRQSRRAG